MPKCRTGKKGGGVAAIFKSVFQCKEITLGDFSSFEYLCFLLKGDPKVIILIIYRPPRYSLRSLLNCCQLSAQITTFLS